MEIEALVDGTIPVELAAALVGAPAMVQSLKFKPGRRLTARAVGTRGSAIVKVYASHRAETVARRVSALAVGPQEPLTPRVLTVDTDRHLVALSEVPGEPLGGSFLSGDLSTLNRAGRALGRWHSHWRGANTVALRAHTPEREAEILLRQAERAPPAIADRVRSALPAVMSSLDGWHPVTVVHRDLYEDQIIVGESIGLIDLDDAGLGPPELDVGNLVAHVDLMALRTGRDFDRELRSLLDGYLEEGPGLDPQLAAACRRLTRLRLACIHRRDDLLAPAGAAF